MNTQATASVYDKIMTCFTRDEKSMYKVTIIVCQESLLDRFYQVIRLVETTFFIKYFRR